MVHMLMMYEVAQGKEEEYMNFYESEFLPAIKLVQGVKIEHGLQTEMFSNDLLPLYKKRKGGVELAHDTGGAGSAAPMVALIVGFDNYSVMRKYYESREIQEVTEKMRGYVVKGSSRILSDSEGVPGIDPEKMRPDIEFPEDLL
ncbi:MAG: hypothetical protein HY731_04775 [Candidatus Tectomicrobia bacterium]|nr:hypothetical protein [Candidatus Tectomicrobia bacterium]